MMNEVDTNDSKENVFICLFGKSWREFKKEVHSLENPAFMLFEVWKTPDLTQKEVFLSTQNIKEVAWDKICDIYRSQIASSSKLQER